ncbi:hypothetical protein FJZ36_18735 [Candidatus Poribacteria bacterium]|nr:hypothetical protein [Candidatus Poribacteria bacterium]
MRRNLAWLLVLSVGIVGVLAGCATGSPLGRMSPVRPLAAYEGDDAAIVVDAATKPEPTLELTKEGVTVRVQYWRKYELDRKLNKGTTTSAFYTEPTWKQGDQVDVFHVSIKNDRKALLRVALRDFYVEDDLRLRADMDGNIFRALSEDDNQKRLLYKKGRDLSIANGFETIHPLLFETAVPKGEIEPGVTTEGFVPFYGFKPNATKLVLTISVEAAPEDSSIGRYRKLDFQFPFGFDRSIFAAQPATVRY